MATHTNVTVECVNEGGKLRVRPAPGQPGVDSSRNVQFPRALRTVGLRFTCTIEDASGFYRALPSTIVAASGGALVPRAANAPGRPINQATRAALDNQVAAAALEKLTGKRERRALEPDEVIDAGRDLTVRPSATARVAYRSAAMDERRHGQELRGQAMRHAERLEEWPAFVRELFARLYDDDGCKPLPDEERSAWGAQALGALEAQEAWSTLREAAQVSRVLAADAASQLAAAVSDAMGLDRLKTDEETRRDPREVMAEAESVARLLAGLGVGQEEVDAMGSAAAEQAARATGVRRQLDAAVERGRPSMRAALGRVAKQAKERAETLEALNGLGFSRKGPGSVEAAAPELLDSVRLDPRMAAIIRWAGRFREAAAGELARANGRCDVIGVRPTGDVARLTPRPRADLASGGVRALSTMRDLLEQAAQGWEQRDRAPKTRGDVGLLVDRSGSMSGEREVRARGLAIAALVAMLAAGRRVACCSFAGHGDARIEAVTPGDAAALGRGVRVLALCASGGTDVDFALGATAKAMAAFPGGMRDPDVLVVTDGYFPTVAQPVLAQLGERRLFGVMLDCGGAAAHPEFDACWDVSGPLDEAQAGAVIAAMRKPRRGKRGAA